MLYTVSCVQQQSCDSFVQMLSSLQALAHMHTQALLDDRRAQLHQYDKSCAGGTTSLALSCSHLQLPCLINRLNFQPFAFKALLAPSPAPFPGPLSPCPPPPPPIQPAPANLPQICTIPLGHALSIITHSVYQNASDVLCSVEVLD